MPPTIRDLATQPELAPQLQALYLNTWPEWFGPKGPGDLDFLIWASSQSHGVPRHFLALDQAGKVIGAVGLTASSIPSHRHLAPWVTGLCVVESQRGKGVASALIAHVAEETRNLGLPMLHIATSALTGILKASGWQVIDEVPTKQETTIVYQKPLNPA